MSRLSHKTLQISQRLVPIGSAVADRPGSSARSRRRVPMKKDTITFKTFVAHETPLAEKIDLIRGGVAARVVDDMVEYLGVSKQVIFQVLHTPESTAHKLIKDKRRLSAAASERVVRVADITRIAEETFGGQDAAAHWLTSPNLALGGVTPLSMLDTEPGASEIRRILSSINYGGAV